MHPFAYAKKPGSLCFTPGQMAYNMLMQYYCFLSGRADAQSDAPAISDAREMRIRQHMKILVTIAADLFITTPPSC